ncbi:MAG: zinc ribbon domain-containing protein [Halobacteriales archaeon]|nr:zinc ribbon domain-containing protein [Halobacteriales archaeon]
MRDSKITFRVSDDLLDRVDEIDESRSEIMRDALRAHLEGGARETGDDRARGRTTNPAPETATLDDVLHAMVRDAVSEAVDEAVRERLSRERENVNVTVNVPEGRGEGRPEPTEETHAETRETVRADERRTQVEGDDSKTCHQCGEEVADDHVHCPNCGAKTAQRLFCDCGDEIRSDWSFCPSCGRRTPTSHALSKE